MKGHFKNSTHCFLVYIDYKAWCQRQGYGIISYAEWLKDVAGND
jgi:hypothetical protein